MKYAVNQGYISCTNINYRIYPKYLETQASTNTAYLDQTPAVFATLPIVVDTSGADSEGSFGRVAGEGGGAGEGFSRTLY